MAPSVFMAVLLAAAFHASWNAIVKLNLDGFLSICLIALAAGGLAALTLPFVPAPGPASWPWLGVGSVLHTGYNLFLSRAYRAGDLGQVYPIARGSAPLFVALVSLFAFGEVLPPSTMLGIGLLVVGVWLMSLRGGRALARLEGNAVGYALATSVFIASYTLVDGLGARVNGEASGYAAWLFVLDGAWMLVLLLARRGTTGLLALRQHWAGGLAGGGMSLAAYWIVIWAMTVAPIPLVAALRESSVLFAAAISVFILGEPLTRWRALSAVAIVAGIFITRMGQ